MGVIPPKIWLNISWLLLGDLDMILIVLYGGKHRIIPPLTATLLLDLILMAGSSSQMIFIHWMDRKLDLGPIVGLLTNKAKWR